MNDFDDITRKRCAACGKDVTQRTRTRDASGAYYCSTCWTEGMGGEEAPPTTLETLKVQPIPGMSAFKPRPSVAREPSIRKWVIVSIILMIFAIGTAVGLIYVFVVPHPDWPTYRGTTRPTTTATTAAR